MLMVSLFTVTRQGVYLCLVFFAAFPALAGRFCTCFMSIAMTAMSSEKLKSMTQHKAMSQLLWHEAIPFYSVFLIALPRCPAKRSGANNTLAVIGQSSHDVIGLLSVKPWFISWIWRLCMSGAPWSSLVIVISLLLLLKWSCLLTTTSVRLFVFSQSCAKVSVGLSNASGLVFAAVDLVYCSLSVLRSMSLTLVSSRGQAVIGLCVTRMF